jgi:uncharacterized protein YndB with AHSA1/START domain
MRTPSWTHEARFTLPAPPGRVFEALTRPEELARWFAEHVEVEPGRALRFWGKHTYGAPGSAREAGEHRITRFDPDRALAFEWRFEGQDSEVAMELSEATEAGQSALALRHAFPAKPALPWAEELVDDLWRLHMGNLDAHLRGGAGIVLPDYTDPSPEIRVSILIDAPRERVFRALLDPAALNAWIASAAVVEPQAGGTYSYGWKYAHGGRDVEGGPTKILDLVENERLVTDWTDWRGQNERGMTRVAWLLETVGKKTKVTLVHGGFSRAADMSDYPFGWGEFLGRLRGVVEAK